MDEVLQNNIRVLFSEVEDILTGNQVGEHSPAKDATYRQWTKRFKTTYEYSLVRLKIY